MGTIVKIFLTVSDDPIVFSLSHGLYVRADRNFIRVMEVCKTQPVGKEIFGCPTDNVVYWTVD